MLFIRRSATLAVLTVLACTVTLLGAASPGSARKCSGRGHQLGEPQCRELRAL